MGPDSNEICRCADLLRVRDLSVRVGTGATEHVVTVPKLDVAGGQVAMLIGGSGVGKSVLLRTLAGMEPDAVLNPEAQASMCGKGGAETDLLSERECLDIFYLFQTPRAHLDSALTIRDYVYLLEQRSDQKRANLSRLFESALQTVGFYGSMTQNIGTLSGGQAQRFMLALVEVLQPKLILADEPLSALDPSSREWLLRHLNRYVATSRGRNSLLFVTHDIPDMRFFAKNADDCIFHTVEETEDPHHFRVSEPWRYDPECRLFAGFAGSPSPATEVVEKLGRLVSAYDSMRESQFEIVVDAGPQRERPLVEISGLDFAWGGNASSRVFSNLNMRLGWGKNMGIIGRSGIGKSTLAELILKLIPTSQAHFTWDSAIASGGSKFRAQVQYVFQDCERAILWEVGTLVEVLRLPFKRISGWNVDQKVFDRWLDACLEHLDLQAHRNKKIQHLSGGQQRRAYLARAILVLLVSPHPEKVLILDEFTSGLDMIVQYRILSWLRDLSAEEHSRIQVIVISHDPIVVNFLCDAVYSLDVDDEMSDRCCNARFMEISEFRQEFSDFFGENSLEFKGAE